MPLGPTTRLRPKAATRATGVEQITAVATVPRTVLRNRLVDPGRTGGITVMASRTNLIPVLHGGMAQGMFLNEATSHFPVVVLGSVAAQRFGITTLTPGRAVWLGGRTFTVVGVLTPLQLAPDIDHAALIGYPIAQQAFRTDGSSSTIYVRTDVTHVNDTYKVLGATANPAHPDEVEVSQPSSALSAQLAAKNASNSLFLGLGGVAVLVGAVGIANVMVISVLERRSEIGLRRATGATRRHITAQFLMESVLLAALGGIAGCGLGAAVTAGYAQYKHWQIVLPAGALGIGIGATLVIGAVAGLYPAVRAARPTPVEALRTV
ncbi:MAG: hypothetical protein JWN52_7534 [Actinomycetia bacterium]|nr:hypothetical protein [Actinomycetes bacterium]